MLQDFLISLASYRRYPELLKNSRRRVIAFGALLVFVFWLMTAAFPYAVFQARTGGIAAVIQQYVPEFTLKDGKLDVPGGYQFKSGTLYVNVNTDPGVILDPSDREIRTRMAMSDAVVLADSEKLIYGAGAAGTFASSGPRVQYFSTFGDISFTKADLIGAAPQIESMYRFFAGMLYFVHLGMFFAGCAVIAGFGQIFAGFASTRLSYGDIYRLSVYSRSAPLLLKGVLALMGLVPAELPALSLLYSLFVLSRAFRYVSMENMPGDADGHMAGNAPGNAPEDRGFSFEELRAEMERRGIGPGGSGSGDAAEETAHSADSLREGTKEPGANGQPGANEQNGQAGEHGKPAREPDLLLPKASEKKDIRPSDGWSFGNSTETASDIMQEREMTQDRVPEQEE